MNASDRFLQATSSSYSNAEYKCNRDFIYVAPIHPLIADEIAHDHAMLQTYFGSSMTDSSHEPED